MQAAYKGLFLVLLVATMGGTSAATCSGDTDVADVPYTVDVTNTGDDTTTTFVFTVCSTECTASDANCAGLTSISFSGESVTTSPASSPGGCGLEFTDVGSLSSDPIPSCEAFYVTADKASATLTDLCGGEDCKYSLALANGATVAGTIDAAKPLDPPLVISAPAPKTPTPYGRRRRMLANQQRQAAGVEGEGPFRRLSTGFRRRMHS